MSFFSPLMTRILAAKGKVGVPALAKAAKVDERTLHRLLKDPPRQIEALKRLDAAAEEIMKDV